MLKTANPDIIEPISSSVLDRRRAWRENKKASCSLPQPVEVKGKPVTVHMDLDGLDREEASGFTMILMVYVEDREVYRYHRLSYGVSCSPYLLENWNDHWVLETKGMLILDGEIANLAWGYDEIFDSQLLNGKPFYFGVRDGKTYLVYDGQPLPVEYDYVYHGMCCEQAMYNVAGNEQMVWFYALRDGIWYYVEMGVYPCTGIEIPGLWSPCRPIPAGGQAR
ncbi:MAG TPA: hypothetical protein ENJ31_12665 [Anaerolineae bacterium]|nr:hypothetical protein [Anaerolineae bacterium]